MLAGIVFGIGMAIGAVNFMAWLFPANQCRSGNQALKGAKEHDNGRFTARRIPA